MDPKTFYLGDVEALVIDSLTQELARPDQIKKYAETYMRERRARAEAENRRRVEIENRLKANERENTRLVDLMIRGVGDTETLGAKSKELASERDQLRLELDRLPAGSNVVVLPSAVERFASKLADARNRATLEMTLHLLDDMGELQALIRELIQSITLYRDEPGKLTIHVDSYLEPFLTDPGKAHKYSGAVPLVAEEGLEPPTRGL